MPRIARVVVPWYPHHVTHRGNRRQQTFFCDDDYPPCIVLMAEWCRRCGVEIWAYCLMPNHVHLIAVPNSEDGQDDVLAKAASLLDIVDDWRAFLSDPAADGMGQTLQHHERTGRPLGDENFLTKLEGLLNRVLKPRKPGRKPKKQKK